MRQKMGLHDVRSPPSLQEESESLAGKFNHSLIAA